MKTRLIASLMLAAALTLTSGATSMMARQAGTPRPAPPRPAGPV